MVQLPTGKSVRHLLVKFDGGAEGKVFHCFHWKNKDKATGALKVEGRRLFPWQNKDIERRQLVMCKTKWPCVFLLAINGCGKGFFHSIQKESCEEEWPVWRRRNIFFSVETLNTGYNCILHTANAIWSTPRCRARTFGIEEKEISVSAVSAQTQKLFGAEIRVGYSAWLLISAKLLFCNSCSDLPETGLISAIKKSARLLSNATQFAMMLSPQIRSVILWSVRECTVVLLLLLTFLARTLNAEGTTPFIREIMIGRCLDYQQTHQPELIPDGYVCFMTAFSQAKICARFSVHCMEFKETDTHVCFRTNTRISRVCPLYAGPADLQCSFLFTSCPSLLIKLWSNDLLMLDWNLLNPRAPCPLAAAYGWTNHFLRVGDTNLVTTCTGCCGDQGPGRTYKSFHQVPLQKWDTCLQNTTILIKALLGDLRMLKVAEFWATETGRAKQITCRQWGQKVCVHQFQTWIYWVFLNLLGSKTMHG